MQFNIFPTCTGKMLDLLYYSINNIYVPVTVSATVFYHQALLTKTPIQIKLVKNDRVIWRKYNCKKLILLANVSC